MLTENRSIRAALIEKILRAAHINELKTIAASRKYMDKRAKVEDQPLKINTKRYGNNIHISELDGNQILKFGNNKTAKKTVIYLHGGAYVGEIMTQHLKFCNDLSEKINGEIYVPIYPLAPNHDYKETYKLLTSLYEKIIESTNNSITIMGDSAGGGLAIAFCQYIKTINLKHPDNLIALSPWVDISMSGDEEQYNIYQNKDPLLGIDGLKEIGKVWAGDLDDKDPKVSPMFGDNYGLPKTLLLVGTHELFYPDVVKYYEKLKSSDVVAKLIIGKKMNHVYPIYPIPEAKVAFEQIVKQING